MSKVKLAVIYYSSTGTNYQIASAVKDSAENAGAEVRLRKIQELAPDDAIDQNPEWRAHVEATKDIPEASLDDLDWADAYGTEFPDFECQSLGSLNIPVHAVLGIMAVGARQVYDNQRSRFVRHYGIHPLHGRLHDGDGSAIAVTCCVSSYRPFNVPCQRESAG